MEIKYKILGITLVCLSLCVLFFGMATSRSGTNGYDPWVDLNDDGNIDYNDLYIFARAYGSSGTPINKTALLLELLSRIDSLNASLIALESRVEALEARIPKKGYIFVSPATFNPTEDVDDKYDFIRSSALIVFRSSVAWVDFCASVQLPHQSIITNMSVWIYDNSDYQINVWLSRYDPQTETANTIASVSTYPPTAKPGKVTLYDDTITYGIVDNSRFMYNIYVRFQGETNFPGDMALRLYGVLIEYEYPA